MDSTAASAPPDDDPETRVHGAITRALLAGKLRPGTALRERALAEMFGCTRGAVRKVLARLGQEGKLEIVHNRGAFVPQPTVEDIRAVYEARSALEVGILALLARRLDAQGVATLEAHVRAEELAWRAGNREESVRLAGGFHLRLIDMLNNPELTPLLQRLVARTQLFVALYEKGEDSHCAPDEHRVIVDALARGDAAGATEAMLTHLEEVQARVLRHARRDDERELREILTGA
ncbi:GntR family transcriptional regulator [Verticiella sediminum]|nr:GntR family transcriptional regulator [Verticiella sediminum]